MSEHSYRLEEIDECFQGVIPAAVCTVSKAGIPNITYLSIVHRLDESHVGLSRQFFNKTIANMSENPRVQTSVVEPGSGRIFRLDMLYERTETDGPVFDRVKTNLEAVASQEGMAKVFRLAAVDVCRVLSCTRVPGDWNFEPAVRAQTGMDSLDAFSLRLVEADNVEALIETALDACADVFGCEHAFVLFVDESGRRLYTVGSRGYEESGIGAEVHFGEGIIGIAAQHRRSVRIGNMASDIAYIQAIRSSFERAGATDIEKVIPLPGLPQTLSQLAVPIMGRDQLFGVLCLQSEVPGRFTARDEAALNVAARQIGLSMLLLRFSRDHEPMVTAELAPEPAVANVCMQVRYYASDDSIFIDNEYVIKGVAGRVLWRLLRAYADEKRVEFTNKEIRLDPQLDLPDIKDNLEARLILLRQRLSDRCSFLRILNTGRGRFRLEVQTPFELREVSA